MTRTFKLPRLYRDWEKNPIQFARYYNEAMDNIESLLQDILSIPAIQDSLDDLDAATLAAQSAANAANAAAADLEDTNNVVNSYIDSSSFTTPLIQSDSSGSVTIKAHDRILQDGTLINVNGATINTAASSSSTLRFYYDSSERTNNSTISPTYSFTTDPASPPVQGGDRFSVGAVTVPSTGTSDGLYVQPPGYLDLS